ncbi:hypothetical protein [Polymorphobacter megasporae]|uniref:hypothetical protein n=1 Tax=Glacieibacterium megasporae TaxID=2835787 RepID=UPI001CAA78FF|nr:hypothetical protein [Polymorphobacter megasporae]UAJ08853.1 hypothetical protein KTC28_10720 [Polymorphobacter megasporae]
MTWMGDLLDAVGKVIKLDDRVTRLDASVKSLTGKVSDTRDRVIRLEGLIEGALRTRTTSAERQRLPKPGR